MLRHDTHARSVRLGRNDAVGVRRILGDALGKANLVRDVVTIRHNAEKRFVWHCKEVLGSGCVD